MHKNQYPSITFAIVVFNEEKRIAACLNAIKKQVYPYNRISVLVIDGGSSDKTVMIAKKYGAEIIYNEKKLAEPGLAKAYQQVKTDYMVFMAADNIVFDDQWTKKILNPFIDNPSKIYASFSRVINDENDNNWNKYLNENTDPFSAFVFGSASHPDLYPKIYPIAQACSNYIVYNFSPENFPLIALAQCTVLKTGLQRTEKVKFDDIAPLIEVIKQGKKIAFVKDTGIRHYSVTGFKNFCKKFKKRIYNSMKTNSYKSREGYVSNARKIRRFLFLPYSFFVVLPLLQGIYFAFKKRKIYMLLHPIACFIIGYYIMFNIAKIKIWQK